MQDRATWQHPFRLILAPLVDQAMELVELRLREPLVLEQVGDQAADVAAEDPLQQVAGRRPFDPVLLELGEEEEGPALRRMADRPLRLELAQSVCTVLCATDPGSASFKASVISRALIRPRSHNTCMIRNCIRPSCVSPIALASRTELLFIVVNLPR